MTDAKMTPKEALEKAIDVATSQTALAAAIGGDVKTGHVYYWLKKGGVPAEYCPAIERECRRIAHEKGDATLIVTCEELCPDVAWGVLRHQATDTPAEATQGG
jgi:DNA-binding transcriptional regulator YdaS (Cro superfamily)